METFENENLTGDFENGKIHVRTAKTNTWINWQLFKCDLNHVNFTCEAKHSKTSQKVHMHAGQCCYHQGDRVQVL